METFGEVFGMLCAGFVFYISSILFKQKKDARGVFVLIIASLILLCSFQWFQGWAKTFIASKIISNFEKLTEQVNAVQATTTDMQKQLDAHQTEIEKHQTELNTIQATIREAETNVSNQQADITNQFLQLSKVQSDLTVAESNLTSQASALSDVQYWINNIYDKTTNETFTIADTNHILIDSATNDRLSMFIRLSYAPIMGSVEEDESDAQSRYPHKAYNMYFAKNLTHEDDYSYDTNTMVISFHYVIDSRVTNLFNRMPVLNKEAWTDSANRFFIRPDW